MDNINDNLDENTENPEATQTEETAAAENTSEEAAQPESTEELPAADNIPEEKEPAEEAETEPAEEAETETAEEEETDHSPEASAEEKAAEGKKIVLVDEITEFFDPPAVVPAAEAPEEEEAVPEETLPEVPKKKKKKALKVILIIFAVLIAALIALGIVVIKMLGNLGNIKPTEVNGTTASATEAEEPAGSTAADTTAEGDTSNTAAPETVTDENGSELPATEATTAAGEEEHATTAAENNGTTVAAEEPTAQQPTDKPTSQSGNHSSPTSAPTTSSQNTSTTAARSDTTTAQHHVPATSARPEDPATTSPAPANTVSEYDIYRSGEFHVKGTVTDETGEVAPMELAISGDSVYMLSEFEGINIGILKSGKKAYMVYPEKKAYMEINSLVMSMLGEDVDSLFDPANLGFDNLQSTDKAISVSDVTVNGSVCRKYVFKNLDGNDYSYVYISGSKLVRIESADSSGKVLSTIDFSYVSKTIPEDKKKPSSSYEKMNMISFIALLGNVVPME